jgi:hypothetical protein
MPICVSRDYRMNSPKARSISSWPRSPCIISIHMKGQSLSALADRLAPGGRFVLGDVVVPDDFADAVTPLDPGYDHPSRVDEQCSG